MLLFQDALASEGASAAEQRDILRSFVADLERIVDDGAEHFDPVNISTALHTLGSTVGDPDLSAEATAGIALLSHTKNSCFLLRVCMSKLGHHVERAHFTMKGRKETSCMESRPCLVCNFYYKS